MILLQCSYHSGKSITKITPKKILGNLYEIIFSLKSKKLYLTFEALIKTWSNIVFTFFFYFQSKLVAKICKLEELNFSTSYNDTAIGNPCIIQSKFQNGRLSIRYWFSYGGFNAIRMFEENIGNFRWEDKGIYLFLKYVSI